MSDIPAEHPPSIKADYDKADKREDEGKVDGGIAEDGTHIDDAGLKRGEDGTAEYGHDKTCGAELGIISKAGKGYAVNGGEHKGHAGRNAYKAIYAADILEVYHTEGEKAGGSGQPCAKAS